MADALAYPEELTLGNPSSPVGLCTLWTRQERILRGVPADLYAMCGNLYSLWGISLLVRGVLAHPTLRYLVVCGVDYADTGRALLALLAEGLAPDGTLPGTTTHLAPDLDAAAIACFRAQVRAVDLRGCTAPAEIAAALRGLPAPPGEEWATSSTPSGPPPPTNPGGDWPDAGQLALESSSLTRQYESAGGSGTPSAPDRLALPSTGGRGGATWEPDPLGNFLIVVRGGRIVATHATTSEGPTGHRFSGRTAAEVYRAIVAAGLVSQLDHAAYLGAELTWAELALREGTSYRQDEAHGPRQGR